MFETTDEMCENIINIFHKFNPSENKFQKLKNDNISTVNSVGIELLNLS